MSEIADGGMPFPFGVNEFTTMAWSFESNVEQYANLGADAIDAVTRQLRNLSDFAADRGVQIALFAAQPHVDEYRNGYLDDWTSVGDCKCRRSQQWWHLP